MNAIASSLDFWESLKNRIFKHFLKKTQASMKMYPSENDVKDGI